MTTTGPAELTLTQISDSHVLPEGQLMHDQVDTLAVLERVAATVATSAGPVAALLLTGDLADDGSRAAYRRPHGGGFTRIDLTYGQLVATAVPEMR